MTDLTPYTVISFDIFDTLIHRKLGSPAGIFAFVRLKAFDSPFALLHHDIIDHFITFRRDAKSSARRLRQETYQDEGEVTFSEIYDQFQHLTQCPLPLCDFLAQTELDCERIFLFASVQGLQHYKEALSSSAQIIFISDMYLPASWLRETLSLLGFPVLERVKIFVSGEQRVAKKSGQLYQIIASNQGFALDRTWLHIGDDPISDIKKAKANGLATWHADWADVTPAYPFMRDSSPCWATHNLLAFLNTKQATAFLPDDPLSQLGYRIWGPLLFGFNLWLILQVKQHKLQRLLFIARDGWLLKKIFNHCQHQVDLSHLPTDYYILSRKIIYQTGLREWNKNFNHIIITGRTKRSARQIFDVVGVDLSQHLAQATRFGFAHIDEPLDNRSYPALRALFATIYHDILLTHSQNRSLFSSYFNHAGTGFGKIGFVDIGWGGNLQRGFVHSLANTRAKKNVIGLYLATHAAADINLADGFPLFGWLCNNGNPVDWKQVLSGGGVELLEFVLTTNQGSALGLKADAEGVIKPILEILGVAEKEYQEQSARIQAGVLKFITDYQFLLDYFSPEMLISPAWGENFSLLVKEPSHSHIKLLGNLTHADTPGTTRLRKPLVEKAPFLARVFRSKAYRVQLKNAYWKAAFQKRNRLF